jgi:cytochrome c oxidase cbb3-type subunit 3
MDARVVLRLAIAPILGTTMVLGGCQREARPLQSPPETNAVNVSVTDLFPSAPPAQTKDPRASQYEGNAFHITQGQQYFRWYNCNGCHANGGGGEGPALMDAKWRYGGEMEQIYASIVQGRPNGMPSFRDKIPEQQVWQIAAFVRSLSGNADKLAAPSRLEGMRSITPINNNKKKPPHGGDDTSVRGGT